MSELLLEVGTEEIPDWMIPGALKDFEKRFLETLEKFNLGEDVTVAREATARRLVLIANGLAAGQADREETLTGPPKQVAFDKEGNPTKAGEGFAKKAGVGLDQLQVNEQGKLFVTRSVKGRTTAEILAEVLPDVILSIYFPKAMYWAGKTGPRFIRPIRWLVALLDGEVVPFEIAGVNSGAVTQGHRRLGTANLVVTGADDYRHKLASNRVILSANERRTKIVAESDALMSGGKQIRGNPKLLSTLTYLTEYPTAILGGFEESYLSLPDEVLETVMLVHQKYFAVEDESGKLSNAFVSVVNLDGDPDGEIRRGNERVLRARFNDAQFFWDFDAKQPLAERVDDLKAVTFQAELGSYHVKTIRMDEVGRTLADALNLDPGSKNHVSRACHLAKCDLTTEMVGEFPELQGQMGGLYAAAQGEAQEVADAIYDHYLPAGMGDSIPRARVGQLVALADKLTTLGGMFGLGLIPTGSKDPLALRRSAYGVIRIVVEAELPLTFDQLVEVAAAGENAGKLREFFLERLRYWLKEVGGFAYDEINAVLAASGESPADVAERAKAIAKVRSSPDFEPLAVSFKRIRNILEKAGGVDEFAAVEVDVSQLESGAEAELHAAFSNTASMVSKHKVNRAYEPALKQVAALRPAVDKFFDGVLVMAEDEAVRRNRLAFLAQLLKEFSTIADFSEIVSRG